MKWSVTVTNETDGAVQVVVIEETCAVSAQVEALRQVFQAKESWRHATAGIPVEAFNG